MKLVFRLAFVASALGLVVSASASQMSWNDNWDQTNWQRGGDYRYLDMDGDGTLNLRDNDMDGDGTPNDSDTDNDNDGLSDSFEIANGLEPFDPLDIHDDADNDGLTNLQEYQFGTDINNPDTDGDGSRDSVDMYPHDVNRWTNGDSDKDGWTNDIEIQQALLDKSVSSDVWSDGDKDGRPLVFEALEGSSDSAKDNFVTTSKRDLVLQAYVDTYSFKEMQSAYLTDLGAGSTEIDDKVTQVETLEGDGTAYSPIELYHDLLLDSNSDFDLMGFIGRTYLACFNRSGGANGIRYYREMLSTGRLTKTQMVNAFVNSNEFKNRFGDSLTNEEFVTLVYQNVLGRPPGAGGLANWTQQLDNGAITRAGLMLRFIESNEFVTNPATEQDSEQKVRSLGAILLGRDLTQSEITQYTTMFKNESSGLKSVLKGLLSSEDYFLRHQDSVDMTRDSDGDERPDTLEFVLGFDKDVIDNLVTSNSQEFVLQMIRDLNNELISFDELAAHVTNFETNFASNKGAWAVDAGLLNNAEFVNRQAVPRLFISTFLRTPNYAGLKAWQIKYEQGLSLKKMAETFANTAEFANRYGALNNGEYVDQVFTNIFGRLPGSGAKAFWVGKLDGGTSRGALIAALSETAENKQKLERDITTILLFHHLLERTVTTSELAYGIKLIKHNKLVDLINTITNSGAYGVRFTQ